MNYKDDALWQAVSEKNLVEAQRMLKAGANVEMVASDGWVRDEHAGRGGKSLLHHAVWVGDLSIFKTLVEFGADPSARRKKNWAQPRGMSSYHYAAFYNRPAILLYCLNRGADVNMQGE